jgi:hypothetical protein
LVDAPGEAQYEISNSLDRRQISTGGETGTLTGSSGSPQTSTARDSSRRTPDGRGADPRRRTLAGLRRVLLFGDTDYRGVLG